MERGSHNLSLMVSDHNKKLLQEDTFGLSDKVSRKGQKIIAAVFLVTNHLSDKNPLSFKIRNSVISLVFGPNPIFKDLFNSIDKHTEFVSDFREVALTLDALHLAKMISDNNYEILKAELISFSALVEDRSGAFSESKHQELNKTFFEISHINQVQSVYKGQVKDSVLYKKTKKDISDKKDKTERSSKIIGLINTKKVVSIKDISGIFPDVSEKTIQRELNRLLSLGQIKKRGDKRWSVYLSLNP